MSLQVSVLPQTILLVESEPLLLKFVSRLLRKAGLTVLTASDAEQALQLEATFPGVIHLLLTAFTLPRLSGPGLAQKLEWRVGMPVMLMSGYPDVRTIASSHNWSFTEKPFAVSAFLDQVKNAGSREPDDMLPA